MFERSLQTACFSGAARGTWRGRAFAAFISPYTNKTFVGLWLILALAIVAGAFPPSAGADDCETAWGCPAKSAESFTRSVGVNTHLGYDQTIYGQRWSDIIKPALLELGVSHLRDGTFPAGYPNGATVASRYRELGEAGIGLNLLVGHEQAQGSATSLQSRLDWIKANGLTPHTIGIEGSNEFVTNGDPARIQSLRDMQCDIYNRVKADSSLASKPVIGPSSGNFYSDDIWYGEIGDLSGCVNRGNLHPYPGESLPNFRLSRDLGVAMDWGRKTYGQKPYWATESGYWNKSPDGSHVSEQASGVYIPRLLLEYFRRGIERTQLYELIDLNTNTPDVIHNYGLLRTDGSKKPAFTAVRNLLAVLKDSASASGSLGFGITCTAGCHSPIRHVLLRMSSGEYVIALWSESRVWDGDRDTPQPPQSVDLTLQEAPGKVEIIAPAQGTTPLHTERTGSKTVRTVATDDVRLIRLSSLAGGAQSDVPSEGQPDSTAGGETRLERSSDLTTAVKAVKTHTDRADAALNRAVSRFERNKDSSARRAYAQSRREMGRARAASAQARRQVETPGEHLQAVRAQELLAEQLDQNVETLVNVLPEAAKRDEHRIASAARSDANGREKVTAVLLALLAEVPEQARPGIATVIASLSQGRHDEARAEARALVSSQVAKANKRRVISALKTSVAGQVKVSQALAALIVSPRMSAEAKQRLQIAYDAVTVEHASVADVLKRFLKRMPVRARTLVRKIVSQVRTDVQGMRQNRPTGSSPAAS